MVWTGNRDQRDIWCGPVHGIREIYGEDRSTGSGRYTGRDQPMGPGRYEVWSTGSGRYTGRDQSMGPGRYIYGVDQSMGSGRYVVWSTGSGDFKMCCLVYWILKCGAWAGLRDHNRQFHAYSMKIMQYRPLHRLNTGFGQHCSLGSIVYVHINLYFKKSIHGV